MQVCTEILNSRIMRSTLEFKQFLTDHQQVIKKHEAKKEKLKGSAPTNTANKRPGFASSGIKSKMKILPAHHYTSVSTADSNDHESTSSGSGGAVAIEMQEVYQNQRTNSI